MFLRRQSKQNCPHLQVTVTCSARAPNQLRLSPSKGFPAQHSRCHHDATTIFSAPILWLWFSNSPSWGGFWQKPVSIEENQSAQEMEGKSALNHLTQIQEEKKKNLSVLAQLFHYHLPMLRKPKANLNIHYATKINATPTGSLTTARWELRGEKRKENPWDQIWKEMGGSLWKLRGQMGNWANKLLG